MKHWMLVTSCVLVTLFFCSEPAFSAPLYPPVTASSNDREIVLENGIVSLTIDRRSSNVVALVYQHDGQSIEIGKRGQSMYFDSNGGATGLTADIAAQAPKAGYMPLGAYVLSVDLVSNTPDVAEVVAKGGPTTYLPFSTEIHYIVKRGLSGYYAYCIYSHGHGMAAGTVGQSRFVVRGPAGPGLFTDVAVDDTRFGPVDESQDLKTVSDATFLQQDGNVYCKYDNSAFMANHHVHGMLGHGIGVWMINPSEEYVNGGPIKQELTVHQDNTLLNMLQGGHFGGGGISVNADEDWTKFYGPFLVYLNNGPNTAAMFADAKRQNQTEEANWPYTWVNSADYPTQRGTVTGKLKLTDGESPARAWVVLAAPGGDWPMQAKNYEFWTQAGADGSFTIPKVRPGSYALYAYGANQFEQLEQDGVTVSGGRVSNLGVVDWSPVKHGHTLWQIGTPNRTTLKYRGGQDNWGPSGMRHWANFMTYPQNFPNDVTFTIGKSVEATDWNYAQWTWYCKKPYWSIDFTVPHAQTGTATLTFGIAASDPLHGRTTHTLVKVNGQQVGELQLVKSGDASYRSSGEDSLYQLKYVTFPANLLTSGVNEITLGDANATPFPSKDEQMQGRVGSVMYDAIRLEVAP